MWEPKAKGAILSLPWFSLYVTWNRHTRRLSFAMPYTVLRPWRRIRELEAELRAMDHALHRANERYDKIRETNLQLRDALSLYRNA